MDLFQIDILDDDVEILELLEVGFPKQVYTRFEYFESFSSREFLKRFRLQKETVLKVLDEIEHRLEFPYDRNNCISPINQLLVTLRFYATGNHLLSVADFGGMHASTCCRIVKRVSEAVTSVMLQEQIKFPSERKFIQETQRKLYEIARFPKVIGAIDGTHVRIQSPGGNAAEVFRNRKNYFSVNVQAIAGADLKFLNIVARWPGSTHDTTIFNNSRVKTSFETNTYADGVLLGDSAYSLKRYLLTPLLHPTTNAERLYNESHIRTRGIVEKMFGVWKRRFPVVTYGCRLKLSTTLIVIVATAILHNVARDALEEEPPAEDTENIDVAIENGNIRLPHNENGRNNINEIRQKFINYFATL